MPQKKHRNIVWLFVLAFIVAESIFVLVTTANYRSKQDRILENNVIELRNSFEGVLNSYSLVSDVVFHQIIITPQITKLYSRAYKADKSVQAIIRDSLFQLLNPAYINLKARGITALHFCLPDNTSFLRFDNPLKFGDNLSKLRESVRIANAEKLFVKGFEADENLNNFCFVHPISYQGESIGTVELGTSFDVVSQILFQQSSYVYSMIMKKSILAEQSFDKKSNYVTSSLLDDWAEETKLSHLEKARGNLPRETLLELDKLLKRKHQDKLEKGKAISTFFTLNNKKYTVSFLPVFNLKQEHVAYVMCYAFDQHSFGYLDWMKTILGLGTFFLLIITALFYIIYTKNRTIKKQYGALSESDSRYLHIYNTIDIGILSNRLDGSILMANPKMLNILGYESLSDLQTVNMKDVYDEPEIREKFIEELFQNKNNQITHELFWKKKNGEKVLVNFIGKSHRDAGNLLYLESVVQDITELRSLEEALKVTETELRASNAAKDRFFSILAHDLRGPFNSLLSLTEILAVHPETVESDRKKRFIELIYLSVKNLYNLIENLLEWSLAQQGALNYKPKEINLADIVNETIQIFTETAFSKQIMIKTNIDKSIKLIADENMTKTIIRNLISNAIKFTHKEGLIKIYNGSILKRNNEQHIEIVVEDNGIGIEQSDLGKLFQIDSDFTNLGTDDEKGTGLGLVLIKEFVEKHGGAIDIESEAGIGTKVIFTLPIPL